MVVTSMGCGMRLRKALHGKEQSCHEDQKGLYKRVTLHRGGLLFHNNKLINPLSAFDVKVFRTVAKMPYKDLCNLFIGS